jgi:tRNA(Ile)-lysidine synthase
MKELRLDPVEVVTVAVEPDRGGPEAAARRARYHALDEAANRLGAAAVFLGHTRDDQSETVLLGLARGSGARSLAGMPPVSADDRYRRPFLAVTRETTRAACAAEGLHPWEDPHNMDRAYTRVRVRLDALPALNSALGPGVADALARTAAQLREDADALDGWAEETLVRATARGADARTPSAAATGVDLDVAVLAEVPPAVRKRALKMAAIAAGAPATDLFAVHIDALDELVTAWRGQRHVDLPGAIRARRLYGRLVLAPADQGLG